MEPGPQITVEKPACWNWPASAAKAPAPPAPPRSRDDAGDARDLALSELGLEVASLGRKAGGPAGATGIGSRG